MCLTRCTNIVSKKSYLTRTISNAYWKIMISPTKRIVSSHGGDLVFSVERVWFEGEYTGRISAKLHWAKMLSELTNEFRLRVLLWLKQETAMDTLV